MIGLGSDKRVARNTCNWSYVRTEKKLPKNKFNHLHLARPCSGLLPVWPVSARVYFTSTRASSSWIGDSLSITMYVVRGNTLYSVLSLSIYVMMSQRIVNETQSACVCTGSLTNGPLSCPLCWWHHHQHHGGYCHHHQQSGGLYPDFTLRWLLDIFETNLKQLGTTLG